MNRKQLIEAGVAMFKESCIDGSVTSDTNSHGQTYWFGKTCAGGGAHYTHKMNQDLMTPSAVAQEVGHVEAINKMKAILAKADKDCQLAAISCYPASITVAAIKAAVPNKSDCFDQCPMCGDQLHADLYSRTCFCCGYEMKSDTQQQP